MSNELDEYDWIIDVPKGVRTRSVSQLTSYSQCGEQYRLQRVAKVPQRPAGWFVMGHALHEALEAWEMDREMPIKDLEDIYIIAYRNEANKLVEKWPDEGHWLTGGSKKGFQDLSDREDRGWVQVLSYIEYAKSEGHLWRTLDVEREFIQEFGGVPVRGFMDSIVEWADGELEVRDYKSGTSTPASAVQLITYSRVVERVTGTKVKNPSWIKMANPNARTEKGKSTQRIEIDLAEEAAWVDPTFLDQFFFDADRGINSGIYLPNPSDSCQRVCGVAQWCRDRGFASSAGDHLEGLLPLTVKEAA